MPYNKNQATQAKAGRYVVRGLNCLGFPTLDWNTEHCLSHTTPGAELTNEWLGKKVIETPQHEQNVKMSFIIFIWKEMA